MTFFKKFSFWLPVIYIVIIILDVGVDITDYQILAMIASPFAWFNFFQHGNTFVIAIALSLVLWFLIGIGIDKLIKRIRR